MCHHSAGFASNVAAVLIITYLIGGFGARAAVTVTVGDQTVNVGANVTLQCSFSTTSTSSVRSLTWSFTSPGSSTEGNFYSVVTGSAPTVDANYTDRVEFDGDLSAGQANLKLFSTRESDEGTYGCAVTVFGDGSGQRTFQLYVIVDGGWSNWGPWSSCSVTCGNGMRTRNRTCTNPAPANGGADCAGEAQESTTCEAECLPDGSIWLWLGPVIAVVALVAAAGGGTFTWWRMYKGLMKLDLRPLPDLGMEVKWTAPSGYEGASYQVAYRSKGSKDWTRSPDVSTDHPPKYTYTVHFPDYGKYQLCVFVKIDGEDEKNSDIEEAIIERTASDSHNEPSRPVSPLHDNNTSKTDSHVVFMTTDGRSPPLRLEPLVIDRQSPAAKKGKKKRKKVNKANASDEETKPES